MHRHVIGQHGNAHDMNYCTPLPNPTQRADGRFLHTCSQCKQSFNSKSEMPDRLPNCSGRPRGPCKYLGVEIDRKQCEGCGGNVLVKVFACAIHGEATLAKKMDDIDCCEGCREWEAND